MTDKTSHQQKRAVVIAHANYNIRCTLISDLPSNHSSIPSPQCALGTTPHLSIRKKAKEGREEKDRGENIREKIVEDAKNGRRGNREK